MRVKTGGYLASRDRRKTARHQQGKEDHEQPDADPFAAAAERPGRLAGKTALITAAGQGIGRATALAFAEEGARVVATDINEDALASLAQHAQIDVRPLDVTDEAAVAALASDIGGVDILFNCAGYVHHGTILDCAPADWDRSFDLNVRSMFLTIKNRWPSG